MTTTTTEVKTVADVLRFVFAHRAAGTVPEGWRSETEPEKPDSMALRQPKRPFARTPEAEAEYQERLAEYQAAKRTYDAAFEKWQAWSRVGYWFRGYGGDAHRQATSVDPSDLYPITARALGVSESKAKALVRDATLAGDLVRLGGGNAVTYTLPEVIEAREQGYVEQDRKARALAARAEAVGLVVHLSMRRTNYTDTAQAVGVVLDTTLERLVEMLESLLDG